MTIEHVLPQTATPEWNAAVAAELHDGEGLEQVYESLVHTLGNLTLTGYNTPLSNKPFDFKRAKLATSGRLMNQEIASQDRWGRTQIRERAGRLAERIIELWPGPDRTAASASTTAWDTLRRAIAELPSGSWTTYGDLAALIGSHPVTVGSFISSNPVVNGHRVLQSGGSISGQFHWSEPGRTDDLREVLASEGVEFDAAGRANPAQRVTTAELAELVGLSTEDIPAAQLDIDPGQDPELRDRFLTQLSDSQGPLVATAVAAILAEWTNLGGHLGYGTAAETSCFLHVRIPGDAHGGIWPITIYPSGRAEVVFQYLRTRAPFDDLTLREELREQMNAIRGIDLPAAKDALRPGFDLSVLETDRAAMQLAQTLAWFYRVVRDADIGARIETVELTA